MKSTPTRILASVMALMFLTLTACSNKTKPNDTTIDSPPLASETVPSSSTTSGNSSSLAKFADVRGGVFTGDYVLSPSEYKSEDMYTYQFNEHTVFTGNETLQQEIIENGKNPGLGIRALHGQGITGEGVSVAIMDEIIFLESVISVPVNFRTTVEQYDEGNYFFRYGGQGGESWGVPYAAGVLALGWQINPRLSPEEIKKLLINSAYENKYGERIIYPLHLLRR